MPCTTALQKIAAPFDAKRSSLKGKSYPELLKLRLQKSQMLHQCKIPYVRSGVVAFQAIRLSLQSCMFVRPHPTDTPDLPGAGSLVAVAPHLPAVGVVWLDFF